MLNLAAAVSTSVSMATITPRSALLALAVSVLAAGAFIPSASGGVIRRLDFETGNLQQWDAVQAEPGRIAVVRTPVRQRRYAARFVVRPGDSPVGKGERSELLAHTGEREGTTSRWRWSTYFPKAFRPTRGSWNDFVQWHHTGDVHGCGPPILFRVNTTAFRRPKLQLSVSGGDVDRGCDALDSRIWNLANLRRKTWYDFSFFVRWSSDRDRGAVGVVLNGRPVVRRTHAATLYRGYDVYLKQGFYRQPASYPTVVLQDAMRRIRP
jgi:hypothetical protein